jgi:hypothetical protein
MNIYKLTAFEANGEKIIDEAILAKEEVEAKQKAELLLREKHANEKTHRLVSADGKLLLFKA